MMADVDRRREHDIDKGWAWVVAIACFFTMFTVMGLFRSAGVIYVALVEEFHISREEAAWPLSLCGSVMCLIGPTVGILTHYISIRILMIIGTLLTSIGVSLCFFAKSLSSIIVFVGAIHGIGIGFVLTVNPVIINQYFNRYRTTAIGISFAGSSAGSFVLPPLTEYLLETYRLRGSFLLLGGILLHGVVAASLCRSPSFQNAKNQVIKLRPEEEQLATINIYNNNNETEKLEDTPEETGNKCKSVIMKYLCLLLNLFSNPMYMIILISYGIFFLYFHLFLTVIVDFALDRSVPTTKAVFIISAFSIADLFGRLASGWIIDFKLIKRKTAVVISFISTGVLLAVIPLSSSYAMIIAFIALLGLLGGSVLVNFPILITEYLGLEQLAFALGISNFIFGLIGLFRPMMIGHYRDVLGSYDSLFYTLGVMHVFGGLFWITESFLNYCRKKKYAAPSNEEPIA